jgi:hypothetical protein
MDITFWIIFACFKYISLALDLIKSNFFKNQQTLKNLDVWNIFMTK